MFNFSAVPCLLYTQIPIVDHVTRQSVHGARQHICRENSKARTFLLQANICSGNAVIIFHLTIHNQMKCTKMLQLEICTSET